MGLTVLASVLLVPTPRMNQRGRSRPSVAAALALGTKVNTSWATRITPDCLMNSPLIGVMVIGTFWARSSRRWEVTTTSRASTAATASTAAAASTAPAALVTAVASMAAAAAALVTTAASLMVRASAFDRPASSARAERPVSNASEYFECGRDTG